MKTIIVRGRSKAVNDLLKKARKSSLILQSADGQLFVLASIQGWQGFDVGNGTDFALEVKRTVRNKKLMKSLAERRTHGKRISLGKIKKQLGLDR